MLSKRANQLGYAMKITRKIAARIAMLFCLAIVNRGTAQPHSLPLRVDSIGDGAPILFIPGFSTPGEIWKPTILNLSGNFKAYYFSYAGFNGNAPVPFPWYDKVKDAVIGFVCRNNLRNIVLVGHSVGGNLAVDVASELPDRINRMILVDVLPALREVLMPGVPVDSIRYDSPYNNQLLAMDDESFGRLAGQMASGMTLSSVGADSIKLWIMQADRKTWVYGYTDILKFDQRNRLAAITCKVLVVGAPSPNERYARLTFEQQYSELHAWRLVIAPESRHFIMLDQPKWFYRTLNNFLADDK